MHLVIGGFSIVLSIVLIALRLEIFMNETTIKLEEILEILEEKKF